MLELHSLSKTYRSHFGTRVIPALDNLTLSVRPGEVVGIAGPNGAGKSTLISLLLGFLRPTQGTVRIGGLEPRAYAERYGVAYLAELVAIPPRWTVESAVRRCAVLAGVPRDKIKGRVEALLDQLDLAGQRRKQVRQLSKGNLQRLGLAQALVGDHELIVLDEPTYGLDPIWTQRFRDIVRDLRRPTRTILIASHNLDELERLADRVVILHRGRAERVVDHSSNVTSERIVSYRLKLAATDAALHHIMPDAIPIEGRPGEWRLEGELTTLNRRLGQLLEANMTIVSFGPEESRLENAFRLAMGGRQ